MKYCVLSSLIGVFLVLAARNALGDPFYPNDATIDSYVGSDGSIYGIVVGYADESDLINQTNGTNPTVTIVDGAYVASNMGAHNGSTIKMEGGHADALGATDNASIDFSGGNVSVADLGSSAKLFMTGGTMYYGPAFFNSSSLTMAAGEMGMSQNAEATVSFDDQSTAMISGGQIDINNGTVLGGIQLKESSSLTMARGSLGSLSVNDFSDAEVNGGTIVGAMSVSSSKNSDASNATIGSVYCSLGTVTVTNCTVTGDVDAYTGVVNVFGGTIGGNASADGSPSSGATLSLSLDGDVAVAGSVSATNTGTIAIFSATVTGDVEAHQHGIVGMSDGTLNGGVNTYNNGSFIFNGGTVNGDLYAYDQRTITVNGGTINGTLNDAGDFTYSIISLNITAGTIANVVTNSRHQNTMSGGTIQNNLNTYSDSTFNLSGGSINGAATSYNFSTININNATVTGAITESSG